MGYVDAGNDIFDTLLAMSCSHLPTKAFNLNLPTRSMKVGGGATPTPPLATPLSAVVQYTALLLYSGKNW